MILLWLFDEPKLVQAPKKRASPRPKKEKAEAAPVEPQPPLEPAPKKRAAAPEPQPPTKPPREKKPRKSKKGLAEQVGEWAEANQAR